MGHPLEELTAQIQEKHAGGMQLDGLDGAKRRAPCHSAEISREGNQQLRGNLELLFYYRPPSGRAISAFSASASSFFGSTISTSPSSFFAFSSSPPWLAVRA